MDELDVDSIFKLKVDDLKQELTKRDLPKTGSKADLQERLLQYVTSKLYSTESESVLEDASLTDADTKLEASLEAELDASDPVEDEGKQEEDDMSGMNNVISPTANLLNDELDVVVDHTTNINETTDVTNVQLNDDTKTLVESKPKFSRVTITSPVITEKTKKESRSKRFGDTSTPSSDQGDSEKKKARLGRFSSTSMAKGEPITEGDVEKIKKRAERFGPVSSIISSPKERLENRKERFADPLIQKRRERFGATPASLNITSDMDERKQSRLAKFGAL